MRPFHLRRSLRFAALMLVPAAYFVWRFASNLGPLPDSSADTDAPIRAEGLRSFLVRQGGLPLWRFSADAIEVAPDGMYTVATGVHNAVLFQQGRPYLTFSAPEIKLTNATNDLVASGGVNATGPNGFSFSAPVVDWDFQTHLIDFPRPSQAKIRELTFHTGKISYDMTKGQLICPGEVSVSGPGLVIHGGKVQADVQARRVQVGGGAELTFDPKVVGIGTGVTPP